MNWRLLAEYWQEMCLTARSRASFYHSCLPNKNRFILLIYFNGLFVNIELWRCLTKMCLLVFVLFECSCMMVLIVAASDGNIKVQHLTNMCLPKSTIGGANSTKKENLKSLPVQ